MNPTIRFDYRPTREDYAQLNRHVLHRMFGVLQWFAAALFVCYVLQPFLLPAMLPEMRDTRSIFQVYASSWMVLFLPCCVVLVRFSTWRGVRRNWERMEELRATKQFEFTEDGLRVRSPVADGFQVWSTLLEAEFARGLLLLKVNRLNYVYFAWSAVPATDRPALVALLRRRVPKTRGLERALAPDPSPAGI